MLAYIRGSKNIHNSLNTNEITFSTLVTENGPQNDTILREPVCYQVAEKPIRNIIARFSVFLCPFLFIYVFYQMVKRIIRFLNGDTKRKTMKYNEGTFKYMLKKSLALSRQLLAGYLLFMCLLVISSGYLDRTRDLYRHLYIFGSYSHKNTIIFQ